ncbi:MFS transporter [Micromonospora cathayae]|uniref:MFS transporter n=1 Tax=Micromonospora cathayae TaxID=3028804 RepID=A0ABY7ZL67_9ACTN|nr:MFS transporter [Micromonospora sp. HUAS 3]WDZ83521.1 MFS transporter [Micromonospora sp. HUAS 3]
MSLPDTVVTPATTASRSRTRWLVLAVLCLAQLVVVLDNTVLTVAVPALTRDLDAGTADIQWMINAYPLVQSGLLLTAGSAVDRYGRRRMLLVGLVVFGLASAAAAAAQSTGHLVAARGVLGVGGALLATATLAIAMQVFDAEERPRAIGVWAAVSALGFAAGPPVGGLLLAHFSWPVIFLINLPIVLVCLVAAGPLVPEARFPAGRLDLVGALLSTLGLGAVVYAIISGPEQGWAAPHVLGAAAAGTLLLGLFAAWERRTPAPMLDLRFFRDRRFVGAVSGVVLITFGSAGSLFLLAQQLQFVRGYPAWEAGLRMAPFALTVVLLNLTGVAARLIRRLGIPAAIAAGMTLLAVGLVVAAHAPTDGYGVLLSGLVLMGGGCALANPAIVEAVLSAIPPEKAGTGAGIDGTMAEVGTSLGVAVLGAVLNARFTAALPAVLAAAGSFPAAWAAARDEPERDLVTGAFASAVAVSQTVGAVAVLTGGLLAATLLSHPPPPTSPPTSPPAPRSSPPASPPARSPR